MEKKEIILLVVVGLLVVTAAIQTIQLAKLSGGEIGVSSSSSSVPISSGHGSSGSSSGASLEDLPSMVGGC